ncbi:general substrate transporter [Trichoderma camerunense]
MAPSSADLSHEVEQSIHPANSKEPGKADVSQIDNDGYGSFAKDAFHDAKAATEAEHMTTPLQGFKKYPKAVAWSILVTMAVVMDGYDESLIKSLFAQKAFRKRFGQPTPAGGYQLTAAWQAGTANASVIGIMIGMCFNGYVRERFGMRKTMLAACFVLTGLIFILVFAQSVAMLLVGELLCGICWGIFHATAPIYASEVCPTVLRGYLTTFINFGAVFGHLIAAIVLNATQSMTGRWAYNLPFSLQWIWPVILVVGLIFCPESPWWLVRTGRLEEAEKALKRLTSGEGTHEAVALMVRTTEEEKALGGSSYWDCFKGSNLRRTEIAFAVWSIQAFSGLPMSAYNTYFFEQAGLSDSSAFSMSIGNSCMGIAGTILSWFLLTWFGRRTIFIGGLVTMCFILFIIGFVSLAPSSNDSASWAQAVMLLIWVFTYDLSVGPVAWCVASEVSATQTRAKTIAVGRTGSYIINIIFNVATPYMLNPTAANWKGKTGFFFGGTCALSLVWTFFRLPEFKGRTYEELNILFWKEVPARKFKSTSVDAYGEESNNAPAV